MSNSNIYELENIVWEFADDDDHIVPHPGGRKSGYALENDIGKRPLLEAKCAERNADRRGASDNVIQEEGPSVSSVREKEETMLETSPWSHSSSGGFSALLARDSKRKTMCSTSNEEMTSNQCMRSSNMVSMGSGSCTDEPIHGDQTVAVDNDLHSYQLNNASHTENDLAFFDNDHEGKESNDLLYYGWPEIENFEDVDKMFRSCDSTFGLEIDNDEELSWFSPPHAIDGSDDGLKSSIDFPDCDPCGVNSITDQKDVNGLRNNGVVADQSSKKLVMIGCKEDSAELIPSGPSSVLNPYDNGAGAISHIDTQSQIHPHVSQSRNQMSSERKRKECLLENGVSFIHFDNLDHAGESNHLLNSQACLQIPIPSSLTEPKNSHPSNDVMPSQAPSTIKFQDKGLTSISPMESSHTSNQIQYTENSRDASFQNPAGSGNKKKDKLHHRRLSRNPGKSNLIVQRVDSELGPKKEIPYHRKEVEGQSEVEGSDTGIPGELDSSTVHDSSCMSSVLDEVSVDASSLQQLQLVTEQLDIRTKLCIRDSLYRLAKSAEQRHKCEKRTGDDKDTSGALLSDGTNKCTGFIDIETDTNPIDRSIAHLLFHRPSDPSATATAFTAVPVKSQAAVQASKHGPLMVEKSDRGGKTASANVKVAVTELECA